MILEGNEINGKPIVFTGVSNALHALDNNHILAIAEEIYDKDFWVKNDDGSYILSGATQSQINEIVRLLKATGVDQKTLAEILEAIKEEVDKKIEEGFVSKDELTETKQELTDEIVKKQDILVSGTNIKTINGESLLGEGNIEIKGGGGTGSTEVYVDEITITKDENNVLSAKLDQASGVTSFEYSVNLNDRLLKIELDKAKLNVSVTPTILDKGITTPQNVSISANISGFDGILLTLNDGEPTESIDVIDSITSDKTYVVKSYYNNEELTSLTQTVYCKFYDRTFYGFGKKPEDVLLHGNNKLTKSGAGTYDDKATDNGVNYYIMVPDGVYVPTEFTMNATPFATIKETKTIGGINYTIIKSGSTYNIGGDVNIKAQ